MDPFRHVEPKEGLAWQTSREIIHIQVGKTGNQIGHEFWRDLCEEHKINYESQTDMGNYMGDNRLYSDHLPVFFTEGSKGRWVPRAILLDLNMHDLAMVTQAPLGDLYRPENIVGNDEGSGNCYAKAFHTEGPDLADRCLELVRKECEQCNCLQGVQFTHSLCGGAGSGLCGLVMKTLYDYLDKGSKCIMQNFTLVPAPGISDIVIENYNAALGLQDLLEYSNQVFFFDNTALTEICQKTLEQDVPSMQSLNNIVALCMSGLTSSIRFSGPLNADLRKLQTNLVPFKNAHFLTSAFAPLTAQGTKKYRKSGSVVDLALQMISKDNVTVKCDPLNPGDPREGILRSRFIASWASWRGSTFQSEEIDQVTYDMQKPNSRFDHFFPDWIPSSIASNLCEVPHTEWGESVSFVSNNTCVHEVFDRVIRQWDNMYQRRSHLHVYEQDGISAQDMMESRNVLQYISDMYCEIAQREDKFFEDNMIGNVPVINDAAIRTDEQLKIAQELKDLGDGNMFIERV